ncbi:MAG TPA: MerR family transcriptional regulator [Cyclobacteriaceae bacterium]|nr:MerR family transcriptional regulator [Cyclobacteriaceae bacterium]
MGKYSIRELEKLSGIKAHTIRIWEKRYNIVEPQRTDTNIRFYSDEDLKRIINVSLLTSHGFRISTVADMSNDELNSKITQLSATNNETDIHIDTLVSAMLDLDEELMEQKFIALEDKFGFEKTMTEIVYPFLEKIGVLWQTGNITPAHEHFISNLIRQKIIVSIAGLPIPSTNTLRAMLFLPENELHEIGLLFYHYLVKKQGIRTYYLGQTVPHQDLKTVYDIYKPHFLITSITSPPFPHSLNDYLDLLSNDFPSSKILVSGQALRKSSFAHHANIKFFEKALDLKEILSR